MSPEELERRRAAANPPKNPNDELLETGQEEVFSRTEVEMGRTEHAQKAGKEAVVGGRDPEAAKAIRDEEQTLRQAPESAGPGEPAGG